jgi:hypothetical protein
MIWIAFWSQYWSCFFPNTQHPVATTVTATETATVVSLDEYRVKRHAR